MMRIALIMLLLVCLPLARPARGQEDETRPRQEPPTEWIDAKTGHRVVRLSRDPGSASLYFHQYPYSADGKKLIFTTRRGIWTVHLETREIEQVVEGRVQVLLTGRKTGDVYFVRRPDRPGRGGRGLDRNDNREPADDTERDPARDRDDQEADEDERDGGEAGQVDRDNNEASGGGDARNGDEVAGNGERDADEEYRPQGDIRPRRGRNRRGRRWPAPRGGEVFAANLDTHEVRHVASLSQDYRTGNIAVNADETMLVVVGTDPDGEKVPRTLPNGTGEGRLTPGWTSGDARVLYTVDIATGTFNVIHHSNDWLNHLQCSPTDPQQILFCHEGPWHFVDRTWIIRTDGSGLTQVHPRTMDMEIGGHEFFSNDGATVWYDLQTPRSMVFWLAGYDIATGKRTWYHHQRQEWSVHYNISPDGKLFAGDGGGPDSVANRDASGNRFDEPQNGQWIYLFRPELITMAGLPEQAAKQVKVGVLRAERLVDLSKHDYSLEPNVTFTPDGKWLVFRSNMHGPTHVYAVEIAKAG